ncbi:hypothetical protein NEMBOFW57_009106 [Staphylotrichum longicolle]|uniref:IBR domain-containing protein n=1 Tax=Staphylotrichum longicolle TaxID=669026 RepID=A0AAD4ETA3_9PEZI|nr:hypothetical protein NEMBOFW57_009106 [Staphylotrichum longicolle]
MSANPSTSRDLELALQLQLEDLEMLRKRRKGKAREGETDDFHLATQLYEAELTSSAIFASDQHMCGSIARAIRSDADLLDAISQEEEQAALDREFASRLSTGRRTAAPAARVSVKPVVDEKLVAQLEALYMSPERHEHLAESSAWAASRSAPKIRWRDLGPKIDLFQASLSDESLFPPRCCGQPIPLDSCRAHLPAKLAGEFLAKKTEMETPNRTYCHQATCSAFISQQFIDGEVGTCVRCSKTTCVLCKRASHEGDCPHDPAAQELLRVAAENGWQRCYSCRRLVELDHGCNHMSSYLTLFRIGWFILTCA